MNSCVACERKPAKPDAIAAGLSDVLGPRWWAVAEIGAACAEFMAGLMSLDVCARHAAWYATLAALKIRSEARRRALVPGLVLALYGEIPLDPFERLSVADARSDGEDLIDQVHRFLAGSQLAAVVEIDTVQRRARVTLQIAGTDPMQTLQIDSRRLAFTTARAIVEGLRGRAVV